MKSRLRFFLLSMPLVFSLMQTATSVAQTTLPTQPAATSQPAGEPVNLLASAQWQYSIDGGKTFYASPPRALVRDSVTAVARAEFNVDTPSRYTAMEFTPVLPKGVESRITLNGKEIRGPMDGMMYKTVPGVDSSLLLAGKNTLEAVFTVRNSPNHPVTDFSPAIRATLRGLEPRHLAIRTGPILGMRGEDFLTLTCRLNMPGSLLVSVDCGDGRQAVTQTFSPAIFHRVRIAAPAGATSYTIKAFCREATVENTYSLPSPPPGGKMHFVFAGDTRSNIQDWVKVARMIRNERPQFLVMTGDLCEYGRDDSLWDAQFAVPAKELLATTPFYAVLGNHEADSPMYFRLIYSPAEPAENHNWSQTVGDVTLVGVDSSQDFSAGSDNAAWLDKTLRDSHAKFVFVFNHYPAWTSGPHGKLDAKGLPAEAAVRNARNLLPILIRHKTTAMFAGHDHLYERSELPGGVTEIITGGAGAPRHQSTGVERQNPYSKIVVSTLHYCVLDVDGDACTMRVVTPDGRQIDMREWKARK